VDDQNGPGPLARLLAQLAYLAMVAWMVLPEHKKRELAMRAARTAQSLSGQLARRAAVRSMEAELRTGHRRYELPYLLSLARDQAQKLYERERSA
jgi:hypothetical protein